MERKSVTHADGHIFYTSNMNKIYAEVLLLFSKKTVTIKVKQSHYRY